MAARECHCRPLKYKDITKRNVQVRVRVVSYAKGHMTKCEFLAKIYKKASVSRSCLYSTHVFLDSDTIFWHLTSQCILCQRPVPVPGMLEGFPLAAEHILLMCLGIWKYQGI